MLEYPNKLNIIFDKLDKNNIKPILVGGFVRDSFLKKTSKDIDIELYNVENFEKIQEILKEFGNTNIIGKSFGVIKLSVDDIELDFSLPRLDSKVSSGHTGFKIETFKNLDFKTASKRRDFTINAIAYDIFEKKFLDYYNGIKDIKTKTLRFIDKNTFKEDPLRVLRAVQFCARFEFKMDNILFSTCKDMVDKNLLQELPKERVFAEIKKLLLKSNKPSIGLKLLRDLNINIFEIDEKKLLNIDKFTSFKTTNNDTNLTILLALLYKDSRYNLQQLTNSKTLANSIKKLLHVERFFARKTKTINYNLVKDLDLNLLSLFLKVLYPNNNFELKHLKPKVHGKDLLKKGLKPSKEFTNILQTSYDKQLASLNFYYQSL
jgi:tRNA nucleotidyltransferase (CCA-adding enzyme)